MSIAAPAFIVVAGILLWAAIGMSKASREFKRRNDEIGRLPFDDRKLAIAFKHEKMPSPLQIEQEIAQLGYDFRLISQIEFDQDGLRKSGRTRRAKVALAGLKTGFDYNFMPLSEENFGKIPKQFWKFGDVCMSFTVREDEEHIACNLFCWAVCKIAGGGSYGRGYVQGAKASTEGFLSMVELVAGGGFERARTSNAPNP